MQGVVLVTGARGLLGSALVSQLQRGGYETHSFAGDIRNRDEVLAEVARVSPLWVIHAAAKTDVAACEANPQEAYDVHVAGTRHIVEAARAAGAYVLYISTASVFSGLLGNYLEDDTPEPVNVYNKTKYEGEREVAAYERGYIARLNLIGIHPSGSRGKNFLEFLCDSFAGNKDMMLFDDVYINPLSPQTIAAYVERIMETCPGQHVLHLVSRGRLSKAQVGELVREYFPDYTGTIRKASIDSIADGVARPKEMWLNGAATEKALGIEASSIAQELQVIFNAQSI